MTPPEILLVEDNPDQAELTRVALEDGHLIPQIRWVKDGGEALEYLFRAGTYRDAHRPGLILLDIDLPKRNGIEVLRTIKEHEDLRMIPVIMLTTSASCDVILQCYLLGANSFVIKSGSWDEYLEKIHALRFYWLLVNQGPVVSS
jgi:CheY-like chemotaxis protein